VTDPRIPIADPFAMWREWVAQSERQWNALLNEAMTTDQYGQSLGRFMELYLVMQKSLGEAMGRYFTALNIPTRGDVLALGQRLSAIEERLTRLERNRIVTLLAERAGAVLGYATIDRGELDWSRHVAELRVLVAPAMRGKGLGRVLTQEAFAIGLELGIEKMVAQMTVDQKGAVAVFEAMGFRPEALLRDHVKDRDGTKHDLLILSHEVAKFQAQREAYGVTEALDT